MTRSRGKHLSREKSQKLGGRFVSAVYPLAKRGQSLEAIWAGHSDEPPVWVFGAYRFQGLGAVGFTSLDMPRKARLLPRKRVRACQTTARFDMILSNPR